MKKAASAALEVIALKFSEKIHTVRAILTIVVYKLNGMTYFIRKVVHKQK